MHQNRNYHQPKKRRRLAVYTVLALVVVVAGAIGLWKFSRYMRVAPPSITQVQGARTTESEVRKDTVVETQMIPYGVKTVDDPEKYVGSSTVIQPGAYGVRTLTYEISYINEVEQPKKLVSDAVTTEPVDKVVSVGTKQSGSEE